MWPRFFEPYKGDILIQDEHYLKSGPMYLDDEFLQSNAGTGVHCLWQLACHGVFPQREEFPPGPRYRDVGDFTNFGLLLENQAPRWQVEVVWDAANGQHPHLKVMVIHDTDGKDADQQLLRAELLTLTTIIKARLTHKATRAYADAPVLLFSFLDSRVRVMEANFDGKNLILRFSRLYDFRIEAEEQCSLVVFLTKWWMGQSIDTGLL
ncbi:uncharacterized protein BO66DRAFT_440580 [Aspergillus aculeatinus CBS 121060]|uniref:Uncharacterized protein n=1 Tax=Aspergillus aculeatinus CBS 121060 TaxID=1448322 RepID=A0ACD1H2F0_9EURO|nr:hypothetical protein BO66DRAFT_440580 [Aspergillus aculeatinus CBS 121060]RAH67921.1 hypothetical protein BO66DRAFT_440580 [Aspergillus aculeatinus CBS 121060]